MLVINISTIYHPCFKEVANMHCHDDIACSWLGRHRTDHTIHTVLIQYNIIAN